MEETKMNILKNWLEEEQKIYMQRYYEMTEKEKKKNIEAIMTTRFLYQKVLVKINDIELGIYQ